MTVITSKDGNVDYKPTVPYNVAPKILDEVVMDDGELHYVLDNGRTSLASRYNSLWHPTKQIVNWNAKGDNPDRTKIPY